MEKLLVAYSYWWCDRGNGGTAHTAAGRSSRLTRTPVWEAETPPAPNNLFSAETDTALRREWQLGAEGTLSLYSTCTHPASMAWSTWARFFMSRTSFDVESAHWPFWMGLMKRFRNSRSEPRRLFLMKFTMQWSGRKRAQLSAQQSRGQIFRNDEDLGAITAWVTSASFLFGI